MPARNVVRSYQENSFFHVYNQGIDRRQIFVDEEDYQAFLSLLKRHLTWQKETTKRGQEYETFAGRVELLAFNLAPDHFHLLFYLNNDAKSISELMRRVVGSYTTYFNQKYHRVGQLFQGVFKAKRVESDEQLLHLTRYIHRDAEDYMNSLHSSLPYYLKGWQADWVVPDKIYRLYEWGTYETFMNDYDGYNYSLENIIVNRADN